MELQPDIVPVFEGKTSTWQYIVSCPISKKAVIIDPVLDFDKTTQTVSTESANAILEIVKSKDLSVVRLLETHAHADHLTAAFHLQKALTEAGGPLAPICIGNRISTVQQTVATKYGIPEEEIKDVFDHTFEDGEKFSIGQLTATVLSLPGHTPDHIGYLIGENIFTGDSIFNPDVGSARCDFPGGDARTLYRSMKTLLSLPDHYRLYTGHDYPSGREPMPFVTVGEQRQQNKHAKDGTSEEDFTKWRSERDKGLSEPRLIHQALQVNVRGGRLPTGKNGQLFA